MIYHIALASEFRPGGNYKPSRFGKDNFIHCSKDLNQLVRIWNYLFLEKECVLLCIDESTCFDIRYEDGGDGELFPHMYHELSAEMIAFVLR